MINSKSKLKLQLLAKLDNFSCFVLQNPRLQLTQLAKSNLKTMNMMTASDAFWIASQNKAYEVALIFILFFLQILLIPRGNESPIFFWVKVVMEGSLFLIQTSLLTISKNDNPESVIIKLIVAILMGVINILLLPSIPPRNPAPDTVSEVHPVAQDLGANSNAPLRRIHGKQD